MCCSAADACVAEVSSNATVTKTIFFISFLRILISGFYLFAPQFMLLSISLSVPMYKNNANYLFNKENTEQRGDLEYCCKWYKKLMNSKKN